MLTFHSVTLWLLGKILSICIVTVNVMEICSMENLSSFPLFYIVKYEQYNDLDMLVSDINDIIITVTFLR